MSEIYVNGVPLAQSQVIHDEVQELFQQGQSNYSLAQ